LLTFVLFLTAKHQQVLVELIPSPSECRKDY